MASPRKAPSSSIVQNAVYTDARFVSLQDDPFLQLSFVAALGQSDAYGNLPADPELLASWILPGNALAPEDIAFAVIRWIDADLAVPYIRNGKIFLHLYLSANKRYSAPEYPLPPGLTASKPTGKGRFATHIITDENGNECDPDGDPVDRQKEPAKSIKSKDVYTMYIQRIYSVYPNIIKRNLNEFKNSFLYFPLENSFSMTAGRGACLGGTPARGMEINDAPALTPEEEADLDEKIANDFDAIQ